MGSSPAWRPDSSFIRDDPIADTLPSPFTTTISSSPSTMLRTALAKPVLAASRTRAAALAARPVLARGYHEKVISHYEKPRNVSRPNPALGLRAHSYLITLRLRLQVGSLPKNAPDVGTGLVGAPA